MANNHLRDLEQIASLYHRRGKLKLAEQLYLDLLSMQQTVIGYKCREVAVTLYNIAEICAEQSRHEEAKTYYHRAVDIWQSLGGNEPAGLLWYAETLSKLQQEANAIAEACKAYDQFGKAS